MGIEGVSNAYLASLQALVAQRIAAFGTLFADRVHDVHLPAKEPR